MMLLTKCMPDQEQLWIAMSFGVHHLLILLLFSLVLRHSLLSAFTVSLKATAPKVPQNSHSLD